MKSIVPKMP